MRRLVIIGSLIVLATSARGQAIESVPPVQPKPKFDFDSKPVNRSSSLLTGLDLGGSKLVFGGDRKALETAVGAETFEAGTLVSRKRRKIDPMFFGLSLKKSLE